MEYTIKMLADLAGVSTRTLRYYDQIGLLVPDRVSSSEYRIYKEKEVDALQQILFYKSLGMELSEIKDQVTSPTFDKVKAFEGHLRKLEKQKEQIEQMICNVKKTIEKEKGRITMTDQEKFAGLKEQLVKENEAQYGAEIRKLYGDEVVNKSNDRFQSLSNQEYEKMKENSEEINRLLEKAVKEDESPKGATGARIAELHKEWLCSTWPSYDKQAHLGLADLYVSDQRFQDYYDKEVKGCAAFLRDAIKAYLG